MFQNIENLNSIGFFDIKPGLERITSVLNYLDNPQDKIKYVLVAGTNGKGSVASILSSILVSNGHRTGLYSSPHLVSVTERIKIDNKSILEDEFDDVLGIVFNACRNTDTELSYFELVTASAFVYFQNQKIDLGVLEVGMGGRWDATNVITPLVSVITNISLDHMEHLGETTELIAREKAEIIKENVPVVCGVSGGDLKVFTDKANVTNSDIYLLSKDFNFERTENNMFSYSGINNQMSSLSTNLVGSHQIVNSTLALAVSELLNRNYEIHIDFNNVNTALNSVKINGRFENISDNPVVILDCAHNVGSADALVNSLEELYSDQKFVFLLSMLNDKDSDGFISRISGKAGKIVITKIPNERGIETEQLCNTSKLYVEDAEVIDDYKEAFEYVRSLDKPVCITGSIYLVGLIKEYLDN